MNKCISVECPFDGRRIATIITNNKKICETLAKNLDAKIQIKVIK